MFIFYRSEITNMCFWPAKFRCPIKRRWLFGNLGIFVPPVIGMNGLFTICKSLIVFLPWYLLKSQINGNYRWLKNLRVDNRHSINLNLRIRTQNEINPRTHTLHPPYSSLMAWKSKMANNSKTNSDIKFCSSLSGKK